MKLELTLIYCIVDELFYFFWLGHSSGLAKQIWHFLGYLSKWKNIVAHTIPQHEAFMQAGTTLLHAVGQHFGIQWEVPQLRLLFMGPGGTGKSYIKAALALLLQFWGIVNGIAATAMTNFASANVSGMTTFRPFGISIGNEVKQLRKAIQENPTDEQIGLWSNIFGLFLDECYQCPQLFLCTIHEKLQKVRNIPDGDRATTLFGGIPLVMLSGDVPQLGPQGRPDQSMYSAAAADRGEVIVGRTAKQLYDSFEPYLFWESERQHSDKCFGRMLADIRYGMVQQHITTLQARVKARFKTTKGKFGAP